MRKATNKGNWIIENGVFIGVSTGFDFCTEHELGIKSLQSSAGITALEDQISSKRNWFNFRKNKPKFGLERTTIVNLDNILQGIAETDKGVPYYIFGYNVFRSAVPPSFTEPFESYWDDTSFLIASTDKDKMMELVEAAYNKDLAFTTGGKVLQEHAGIRLVIKSKVPQSLYEQCEENDIEIFELKIENQKIDIQSKLKKAGCNFYACSPRWKDFENREIWWWLNPEDQRSFEAGYYTYDELIQWTKGKGPVIKVEENGNDTTDF